MTSSERSKKSVYLKYTNLLKLEHKKLPALGVVAKKLGIPKNTLSRYFRDDSGLKYDVFQHVYNEGLRDVVKTNIKQKEDFVKIFQNNNKEYWVLSSEYMLSERDFISEELRMLKIPSKSIHRADLKAIKWVIPKNVVIIMLSVSLTSVTHHEVMKYVSDNPVYIVSGYKKEVKKNNFHSISLENVYGSTNSTYIRRKDKTRIRVFLDECLDYLNYQTEDSDSHLVDIHSLFDTEE